MNKYVARLIGLTVISSLMVSCASPGGAPGETGGADGTAQEVPDEGLSPITVWIWEGPEGQALSEAALAYTEETGNEVSVELLARQTATDTISTAIIGGATSPDLFETGSDRIPSYAAGGFIEPFEAYLDDDYGLSEFSSGVLDEMSWDEQIYMLPTDIATQLLFYRTDLLSEPPRDYDAYLEAARDLTQSLNPESETKYGLAVTAAPNTTERNWLSVLWSFGGDILDEDGNVIVNSPEAVESLEYWVGLSEAGVMPPDIATYEYPQILTGLQEGVVGMASQWNAAAPTLFSEEESPQIYDKIAIAPNPEGPAGAFVYAYALGLSINANSENKEGAAAFAEWVTSQDGGLVYTKAGGNNPRASILADDGMVAERPWNPTLQEALATSKGTVRHPEGLEINAIMRTHLSQALVGEVEPQEALDAMAEEIEALIGE